VLTVLRDSEASIDDDDHQLDGRDDDRPDSSRVQGGAASSSSNPTEKAWRYAKKPLLRIGAKGATLSHGNSLRQLLQAHTAVKVKVNTQRFEGDLDAAFRHLRGLAEESGAPAGIECIQTRESDSVILFGMPGTTERIKSGTFPPPPPPDARTTATKPGP
jgi:RNA-binding protein YhbY